MSAALALLLIGAIVMMELLDSICAFVSLLVSSVVKENNSRKIVNKYIFSDGPIQHFVRLGHALYCCMHHGHFPVSNAAK